jgi:glutathione synthase/RimK-type ligase-like ATP-grasp enzyme
VVKPNVGGSGAGVVRFDSLDELRRRTSHDTLDFGLDSVGLVQEFIPARGGHITRVEVLDGKFLYAIKVFLTGETFDLCPADICRTTEGVALENSCPVEAPKAGLRVEGYTPPPDVIQAVERIMSEAGIEVGGVEYIIDDRDGQLYYYDVNALSNFVAGAEQVVGFNPFSRLVDFLERRAADGRR